MKSFLYCLAVVAWAFVVVPQANVLGQSGEIRADAELYQELVSKAVNYLQTEGRAEDGSYSGFAGPAVTALVATGLMKNGYGPDSPEVSDSLTYVAGFVQEDGGIYVTDSLYKNYETSIALLCFVTANENGRYDEIIKNAERFLIGTQWGTAHHAESDDHRFGGFGYGKHGRPDLSNTAYTVEALIAAGNDANSEAIQRALKFISRTQNLPSEHNELESASLNPDGGFAYTPVESKAEDMSNGGLRSYASMTYARLEEHVVRRCRCR